MTKRVIQTGSVAASLLALCSVASADIQVNENFSVGGYAAGSYRYFDEAKADKFDLDAAKINFITDFKPVSAVASIYYTGGTPGDDLTLLDAYVNYDLGDGLVITGGKFLSYLGYEAFDIPAMSQITYANGDFLGAIPGYHSGVKIGYTSGAWSSGIALLDSVYGGLKGDGELRGNAGLEAFVSYTGIEKLTLFLGAAHQSEGLSEDGIPVDGAQEDATVINFWASYSLTDKVTIAGEYSQKDSYFTDGYNWLVFASVATSDKVTLVGRISGEEIDNGPSFLRYTFAPSFTLTENLSIRTEVTFTDYDDFESSKDTFFGIQGVFKF
jgi:hypothetical protein